MPGPLPPLPASYVDRTRDGDVADRSGFVMAAGIVMIVIGGFAALGGLGSMLSVGIVMSAMAKGLGLKNTGGVGALMMVVMGIMYLAPAVNLLVCGIGSLRFRSWARLATIVSSAIWLGLCTLLFGTMVLSLLFAPGGKMGAAEGAIVAIVWGVIAVFVLALPVLLLVLYCRKDVKATFARRSVGAR